MTELTKTPRARIIPLLYMTKPSSQQINDLLTRGVEKVIVKGHLEKRLKNSDKLRLKFGIDPTGSVLHIGHMVVLRKLRELQKLGHTVVFLIGDFTARIGDPTGRAASRPPMTDEQIKENMKEYQNQASKILDMSKTEVRYNSQWWGKMDLKDMILLAAKVTYSQVSAREDFKNRIASSQDFTVQELLYPILQGYDSVALKADVEFGGTDQEFNLLMGRQIQKRYGQEPQDVLTCPLLLGTDGRKMSKSYDNYIGVMESPKEMFGKVMSASDEVIGDYFTLCTNVSTEEIEEIKRAMKTGSLNPRDAKARLAREIVTIYHGERAAQEAEAEFERIFKDKKNPSDIPVFRAKKSRYLICDLLTETKLASSKTESKRLVEQRGVKIDDAVVDDWKKEVDLRDGMVVQVGKRKFVKIAL